MQNINIFTSGFRLLEPTVDIMLGTTIYIYIRKSEHICKSCSDSKSLVS